MKSIKNFGASMIIVGGAVSGFAHAGGLSANISATNNYIWRGLTQTENEAAVQGGLDYAHESGLYLGTWTSNVNYGAGDNFSYEHDLYVGFAGEFAGGVSYDVGYLYYNYDSAADFDFGEIYGSLGFSGFSVTAYVLANTEANEGPGQDFDFGSTFYVSADYGFEVGNGVEIALHVGYHDGDFAEAFNGVTDSYFDYNISISKGGFGFMFTDTDADGFSAVSTNGFDNNSPKWVVSYSVDFDLMSF